MSGCYKRVNFYDLCRLCAQNIQKNKVKIFEQDGERIQLQSKIKKCLSLNVNEDDFLPKVVCSKCIRQLEICNAFREECLNSETMLSTYFKNYRHTEDFKKSGKVYIKDNGKPEQLSDISQSYENEPGLTPKTHKTKQSSISRPATSATQKTEICSKTFVASNSVPTQIVTNKQVGKQDQLSPNMISQIQTMQLPYNIDAITINEALKKAVQQLPKELLNKVIVNAYGEVINLSPPESLNLESLNVPPNVVSGITSVIKNKITKSEDSVKQEKEVGQNIIKIDLTDDDNQQDVHPAKFNATISLNKQSNGQSVVQNPTVIFPVSQYQNNQFSSVPTNNMSYPQQTAVNIPSSTPTVINVICNNPSETSHINPLSQSPPSSINMDDLRSSSYVSSISQTQPKGVVASQDDKPKKPPVKSEDPQKTHACEVCSKTFKRREHLYQHIKLHTGFRPFRCIECNKAFVRKEHLIRHKVLHSGVRNYSCDICSKSFSRHDNLLKHIRTHNKEPAYTCEVCNKVFIIKHYYDAHRSEQGKCYLSPQLRVC